MQTNPYKFQKDITNMELDHSARQEAINQAGIGDEMYQFQQEKKEDLTRWQQDLNEEIDLAIHTLQREFLNEDGKWIKEITFTGNYDDKNKPIYEEAKPMLNKAGINRIRSYLIPLTSRNLMMSNYNEDRIFSKLKGTVKDLIIDIGYHQDIYEIERGDLTPIIRTFKNIAEPAHWRALNNGERNFINTIQKRVEAFAHGGTQQSNSQKGGMMSGILGGKI